MDGTHVTESRHLVKSFLLQNVHAFVSDSLLGSNMPINIDFRRKKKNHFLQGDLRLS